jgi:hypothetical protein
MGTQDRCPLWLPGWFLWFITMVLKIKELDQVYNAVLKIVEKFEITTI